MSHTSEDQGIGELINALNDRTWKTRRQASDALIRRGKPAVQPLMAAIRENTFTVFTLPEAIRALGGIGDVQAVDLLIEELENRNVDTVQEAIKGLGSISNPQAIAPLIDVFRHDWDDPETFTVWREAATALVAIGETSLPALLAALSDEDDAVRQEVAKALGKLHDPRAVGPLIHALQDENAPVRATVVAVLAEPGNERAIEPLVALLAQDKNTFVRARAVSALGTLGQRDSAPVFAPIVSALKDRDPIVRNMAVTALGRLSDTRIHDLLLELLNNPDECVRSAAILTLAHVGDERALPALTWIQQNDTGSSGANKIKDRATYALQHVQERQQKR